MKLLAASLNSGSLNPVWLSGLTRQIVLGDEFPAIARAVPAEVEGTVALVVLVLGKWGRGCRHLNDNLPAQQNPRHLP